MATYILILVLLGADGHQDVQIVKHQYTSITECAGDGLAAKAQAFICVDSEIVPGREA